MNACRLIVAALALLLSATAAPAPEIEPPAGGLPPELTWVPPNCAAFVHVRFADLWDSPAGKVIREAILKAEPHAFERIEESTGVRLSQVDRITVLMPDVGKGRGEPGFAIRVTTTEPYDVKKLLASVRADEKDTAIGENLYELRGKEGLVHLTDAKNLTFIVSRSGAAGLLGRLLEHRASGALSPALQQAAGKHAIVAALDVSQLRFLQAEEVPAGFRPLLDARLAVVTGDLKPESADLSLRLSFARKGHAEDGAKSVEFAREELLKLLSGASRELSGEKEFPGRVKLLEMLIASIKAARVEVANNDVTAEASVATGEPLAILAKDGIAAMQMSSRRMESANNLKQIGLAMHNYHDATGSLPPAAICDKNGKPLLSWRVAILPYIEQDNLYRQFHLDEPWDSEHNIKLAQVMVKVYMLPGDKVKHELPSTHYRVFYGNDAMFDLKTGTKFAQVTDGLSNTLMVVEAADAVPWSKPDDIEYDPKATPKLGYFFGDRCNALFGDGSVRALKKGINERTLHLLIQRSDGNPVSID